MNGMNLPPGFNFDNVPENDLNQVWKILTQLQTSNPKKYRDFIDHVKSEEEKREKLSKIVPLPHSVYMVEATKLDEKLICYINVMKWDRIKYPEQDKPISMMCGNQLLTPRKSEIICHVATNEQVLTEIDESDSDVKKDFRQLLTKFISDNYPNYRFYSNKMKKFERKNHPDQYYGNLPDDTKQLFLRDHSKNDPKSSSFSTSDILNMMKAENDETAEIVQAEKPKDGPKTLVEALEVELKASQIVENKTENKVENQDSEQKPKEAKEKSDETKKILIEEVIENVKIKNPIKEPKYKTEKNRTHWKVFIQLDSDTKFHHINTIISSTQFELNVRKKYKLQLKLEDSLKDEAAHAKFVEKKNYNLLTITVPLLQRDETLEKKEDLFDHSFVQNLQKSFSSKNPSVPAN